MPKLTLPLNDIPAALDLLAETVGALVDANNAIADRVTALEARAPEGATVDLAPLTDRVTALEKAPVNMGAASSPSSALSDKVTAVVEKYFSHEFGEGDLSAPTVGRKVTGYDPVTGQPIYDGQPRPSAPVGQAVTGYDPVTGQPIYASGAAGTPGSSGALQ